MNVEKIEAVIEDALIEVVRGRPYIEVGDLLHDDPFVSELAQSIKSLYAETEELAWQYQELCD